MSLQWELPFFFKYGKVFGNDSETCGISECSSLDWTVTYSLDIITCLFVFFKFIFMMVHRGEKSSDILCVWVRQCRFVEVSEVGCDPGRKSPSWALWIQNQMGENMSTNAHTHTFTLILLILMSKYWMRLWLCVMWCDRTVLTSVWRVGVTTWRWRSARGSRIASCWGTRTSRARGGRKRWPSPSFRSSQDSRSGYMIDIVMMFSSLCFSRYRSTSRCMID